MEEETEEQDGGLGPVRLHQVYPALSFRGALPGPAALQGPWALGSGRAGGFFGRSPRELGARCTAVALSLPAPWGFGTLASSPGDPVIG